MTNGPTVSVVIPTYNHGHVLDEAIQSVLAQTFADFELIVVDNASTDNTRDIVAKFLSDRRVRYYRNPANIGLAGNWNKCLEYAEGTYVKFLCADDKIHPQMLERYVPIMTAHPELAIVCAETEFFGERMQPRVMKAPAAGYLSGRDAVALMIRTDHNFVAEPSNPLLRRSNLVGETFNQLGYVTDWEMWIRQLQKGDCYVIPEVLWYNRRHDGQQQIPMKKLGISYLEVYDLYDDLRNNRYRYVFPELKAELDQLLRIKATKCAFNFYKLLPHVYEKNTRAVIKRLWSVATKEKVLIGPGVLSFFYDKIKERLINRKMAVAREVVLGAGVDRPPY